MGYDFFPNRIVKNGFFFILLPYYTRGEKGLFWSIKKKNNKNNKKNNCGGVGDKRMGVGMVYDGKR